MATLSRTYHGAINFYESDGFGRDGYIWHDNGGLFRTRSPSPRYGSVYKTLALPHPQLSRPMAAYVHDGSGRDSYVDSVGASGSFDFKKSLRGSLTPQHVDPKDPFFRVQLQWLRQRRNRHAFDHRRLTERLSRPKQVN